MGLDLSFPSLMAAFIFSVIGIYLFKQAKSRQNFAWIAIAILLMIYPIFVSGAWMNWGVGIALCAVAYILR